VEEDSVDLYIIPSKYISKVDKNDKKWYSMDAKKLQ
jgi:hypothetical protein